MMQNLDRFQGPGSGLAHALGETTPRFPSLAQNLRRNPQSNLAPRYNNGAKTRSEQQAITILLGQHDDDIFAYLRFARSLSQNAHYSLGHGPLSEDQVRAVWALRGYADDKIRAWLDQARKLANDSEQPQNPRGGSLREPGSAYLSSSGQARGTVHGPGGTTSARASPNLGRIDGFYQSTLNASSVHPQWSLDKTHTSHEETKATKFYWCTMCEDRRPYKNLSDWRKHEKGHVETYSCMLTGPLEETEGDFKCILCRTSNPSEDHLAAHDIHTCGKGIPGSFSCKRRADLVGHLTKRHGVQGKARGEAIAHKWKETTKKQAWPCGFCSHLAHTFGERLKHIATHFERGQTLDEWDITKVVQGPLLQPGMISAWETRLAASPPGWESSEVMWEKPVVKDLQHDLEVGPSDTQHAAALAKEAYEARQSDGGLPLPYVPIHGALRPSTIVPTSDYDSIMERAFEPNSNHAPSRFVANPAETLQYEVPGLSEPAIATYDDDRTFSSYFLDDGSGSIYAPWLSNSGETRTSAADQYIDSSGYQEHFKPTTASGVRPTRPLFSDEPDTDDMLE
ncbi:MAG: hypothetical protein ASARMPRED_003594 [Alectoria sarmentosa]|nr:MAG: hypothetical protein ASARMPRED_003594 [Alectoria sarmentosa]